MNRLKFTLILLSIILLFASNVFSSNHHQQEILFFSNVNAAIKNCNCGNPSLGGLARIITIVKNRRAENPNLLLIDGGDFFNSYPLPSLNNAVVELYDELKPDILVVGDQEFVEGTSFLRSHLKKHDNYLLHSNMQFTSNGILKGNTGNILVHDQLVFLSYIDTASFDLIEKPQDISFSNHYFNKLYHANLEKNNFLIGIFHGPEKNLNEFRKSYPQFDLILLGHAQSTRKQLSGKPFIIGGGSDGENIKKITIQNNFEKFSVSLEDIPVTLDVVPDATALRIIQKWGVK